MTSIALLCMILLLLTWNLHMVSDLPDERILVVTTINVLADIARQIGGERVYVRSIVTGMENPHTYSLKPSDKLLLKEADIYVEIGKPLEGFRDELLSGIDLSKKHIITCLKLPDIVILPSGNPHIWLDPRNALIIAKAIRDQLIQLDPEHSDYYELRYQEFERRIFNLRRYIGSRAKGIAGKGIVLAAPAPEPLAVYMNLTVVDVLIKTPGRQPTPKEVALIEEKIREGKVRALVEVAVLKIPVVRRISEDTGIPTVKFTPLLMPERGICDYFDLLRYDVDVLVDALEYTGQSISQAEDVNQLTMLILLAVSICEALGLLYLGVRLLVRR